MVEKTRERMRFTCQRVQISGANSKVGGTQFSRNGNTIRFSYAPERYTLLRAQIDDPPQITSTRTVSFVLLLFYGCPRKYLRRGCEASSWVEMGEEAMVVNLCSAMKISGGVDTEGPLQRLCGTCDERTAEVDGRVIPL